MLVAIVVVSMAIAMPPLRAQGADTEPSRRIGPALTVVYCDFGAIARNRHTPSKWKVYAGKLWIKRGGWIDIEPANNTAGRRLRQFLADIEPTGQFALWNMRRETVWITRRDMRTPELLLWALEQRSFRVRSLPPNKIRCFPLFFPDISRPGY